MLPDAASIQKPILFSRKENRGFQLPRQWRRGNCVISVDMHNDDDEDTFSFLGLATKAGLLNVICVARPPHYGGTVVVGERQVMNISIRGWPYMQTSILDLGTDDTSISTADD